MKREALGLGRSSAAVDGDAVTWGGGGTGTGSTESCQRGRGSVGTRVNDRAAGERMRLPRRWGQFVPSSLLV